MIIQSNYLTNSGLTKSYKMLLRTSPKYLLNTDKLGALTSCLGSLFQCLNTHLFKTCFLMPSLNLPWCNFKPLPCVLSMDARKKRPEPHSPLALLRKLQRAMKSPLFFSKLDKHKVHSHPSQYMPSRPFTSFLVLPWTHQRTSTSFLSCRTQNCTRVT